MGLLNGTKDSAPAPRKTRGPVVASAARVRSTAGGADMLKRLKQPWQEQAWAYYDLIGEVHDAGQFVGKGLSGLRLFVEKRGTDGAWEEIDPETAQGADQTALDIWNEVRDPGGGRNRLILNYGRQRVIAGESYLLCTGRDDPTQPTKWEMVSTDELRPMGSGTWERIVAPGMRENFAELPEDEWEPLPSEVLVFRFWRAHPRYSGLADSPMRAMLGDCEEIALLAQSIRNKTRNRLKGAGLFLIPDEVSPPEDAADELDVDGDTAPSDDTDTTDDPFMSSLQDAMVSAIANETDASAVVPMMARVPLETIPGFRLIEFANAADPFPEMATIERLINRLARGFDMPPELMLGISMSNHWSAWMIDRQTWKAYLQAYAMELVGDFTEAFLWPQLVANQVTDIEDYRIGYDESSVVNNPDRSKDAKDLFDRYVISEDTLRESNGFDESDAPEDAEIQKRIEILQAAGAGGQSDGEGSGASQGTQPTTEPASNLDGAIGMALLRCRELAGSRVRTKAQRDPLVRNTIDGISNREVCAMLGADDPWLVGLGLSADQLVSGGAECLIAFMESNGYSSRRVQEVAGRVEEQAAAELFTPSQTRALVPA